MTSSDLWDEDTAERYDDSTAEMFAPQVLDPTVDFLARLAGVPAPRWSSRSARVGWRSRSPPEASL